MRGWFLIPVLFLMISPSSAQVEDAPNKHPVKKIADSRLAVGDRGILPLYLSADWSKLVSCSRINAIRMQTTMLM